MELPVTWSKGHGIALSPIMVLTGLPRITPCKPRPRDCARSGAEAAAEVPILRRKLSSGCPASADLRNCALVSLPLKYCDGYDGGR